MEKENKIKLRYDTICVDFDEVIHGYSDGFQDGSIYDSPVKGAIESLVSLIDTGYKIIVYTARKGEPEIKAWLDQYMPDGYAKKIGINTTKPPAIVYIDDRALRFTNWKDIRKYFVEYG